MDLRRGTMLGRERARSFQSVAILSAGAHHHHGPALAAHHLRLVVGARRQPRAALVRPRPGCDVEQDREGPGRAGLEPRQAGDVTGCRLTEDRDDQPGSGVVGGREVEVSPGVDSWMTASDSSSISTSAGALMPRSCQRRVRGTLAVDEHPYDEARCPPGGCATEAAAETAYSKDEDGPVPRCAAARVSSRTVTRLWCGCSSRRTISSPVRAVDRQWIRRRSSPRRYSRTVMSSVPAAAKARGRLSPVPDQSPDKRRHGQRMDDRRDDERGARREGSRQLDEAERDPTAGP